MSDSPSALIAGIQQKIARLAAKREEAENKCITLEARIEALEADLAERDSQLQKANLEIEFLMLSHRLAASPQSLADARKTVSRIIRKVDAAIALIKSDPADL